MKDLLIAVMMVLGMFSITSCTKDVPTPTENSITTEMKVVIPPANDCGKDDDGENLLGIRVIDETEIPLSNLLVELSGNQIYNFETNNQGEDQDNVATGIYTLSVENENTSLVVINTNQNEGILTITIQE